MHAVTECVAKIIEGIAQPMVLGTATAHVSASVGISQVECGMSAEDCLRRSDIAMYSAKRDGRNRQVWFDERMERELLARTRLEDEIRTAIAAGEFIPYYQPQIDLANGQLTGFEVLARWDSPEKGLLEPSRIHGCRRRIGINRRAVAVGDEVRASRRTQLAEPLENGRQHLAGSVQGLRSSPSAF